MTETKIKGLKIKYSKTNLCIKDSYQITNVTKMKEILEEALKKDSVYNTKRKMKSLIREWKAHNRLYRMGLFKKSCQDCDFESKQKFLVKIFYMIMGI